ncbi:RNA helicase Mov10l1 [Pitangus sulphuratus]|nr:RNA helicase Mov10l1 [Pitangus sulphuratus]
MFCLLSKALSYFWRRAGGEDERWATAGDQELKTVQGVVTRLCHDYGMIDDMIVFTKDVVTENMLLAIGQEVIATVEEDQTSGGLKAIRVDAIQDTQQDFSPTFDASELNNKTLIGSITSLSKHGGYINQNTYFAMEDVWEDFKPCEGDWVQAKYFINLTTWKSEAVAVRPLRYKQVNKVRISSICGRTGTVDESIFFTLDSLKLPDGYSPRRHDLVNAIVVESSQSCYIWRALCLVPVNQDGQSHSNGGDTDEPYEDLMREKGELKISRMTNFGTLKQGESKRIIIWIENKGSVPQSLISCRLAGWVKDKQFSVQIPQKCENSPEAYLPSFPINREDLSKEGVNSFNSRGGTTYESSNNTSTKKNGVIPEGINFQDTNLSRTEENISLVKDENLQNGGSEQREHVEQPIKHGKISGETVIPPGGKTCIVIICTAVNHGHSKELLLLGFSDFTVGRYIEATVTNEEELLIAPVEPFSPRKPKITANSQLRKTTVAGPKSRRIIIPISLPAPKRLNLDNYKANFSTLLWLEEIQAEMDLKCFSMSGVTLKRNGNLLVLEVPGVEEGRPRLVPGDKVILRSQVYSGHIIEYIAFITEICQEDVTLKVNADFEQAYNLEPMDVEFVQCRLVTGVVGKELHYGITKNQSCNLLHSDDRSFVCCLGMGDFMVKKKKNKQAKGMTSREVNVQDMRVTLPTSQLGTLSVVEYEVLLFRIAITSSFQFVTGMLSYPWENFFAKDAETFSVGETVALQERGGEFFNPMLNVQQKLAVKRILSGECRPTPYILFGPPGTGKTVTVIEAILQIHYTLPDSRILVCAPSNAATDLICLRLHQSNLLKPGAMVRVNAAFRSAEQIDDMVKPYCKDGDDIQKALWSRIVITTCNSAGLFYQTDTRLGHFTHVILDEAGQASEPESLIPIGLISEAHGQIILVGDPKQLGPTIKSKLALTFGLSMSLLERLTSRELYLRDEDAFGACGAYNPLLGTETREGHSPSWFNPAEAVQVMQYCCHLAKNENAAVSVTDIGVITPYRKQVEKIKFLLRSIDLADIKVGTVEEFQGQEYTVIILSTVRSQEDLSDDEKYCLGFLCNPKRFNVAITRAKALLIVVGNPHVLVKSTHITSIPGVHCTSFLCNAQYVDPAASRMASVVKHQRQAQHKEEVKVADVNWFTYVEYRITYLEYSSTNLNASVITSY